MDGLNIPSYQKWRNKVARLVPTQLQNRQMFKLLEEHTHPTDAEGVVEYNPGWDDERIATEVGVKTANVKYRRQESFGTLPCVRETRAKAEPDESLALVNKLGAQISYLYARLGEEMPESLK